jgi:CRP/FNR family transcriptional regulator, cyclic AMP receptor protein
VQGTVSPAAALSDRFITMQLTLNTKNNSGISIEQALGAMPLFRGLSADALEVLSNSALRTHFRAGQMIFRQGEPANRFYLIEKGRVSLIDEQNGEPCRFGVLGRQEVLGWSWLFPPHAWHFTARAVTPIDAIFFYATPLREACEQNPNLGYELMKRFSAVMVQRLQNSRAELIQARRHVYRLSEAADATAA